MYTLFVFLSTVPHLLSCPGMLAPWALLMALGPASAFHGPFHRMCSDMMAHTSPGEPPPHVPSSVIAVGVEVVVAPWAARPVEWDLPRPPREGRTVSVVHATWPRARLRLAYVFVGWADDDPTGPTVVAFLAVPARANMPPALCLGWRWDPSPPDNHNHAHRQFYQCAAFRPARAAPTPDGELRLTEALLQHEIRRACTYDAGVSIVRAEGGAVRDLGARP